MEVREGAAQLETEGTRKNEKESLNEAGEQFSKLEDINGIISGGTIKKKGSPDRPDGE